MLILVGYMHKLLRSVCRTSDMVLRIPFNPGWCCSVDWVPAWQLEGCRFNSQSGHMPGLQARSPFGGVQEATHLYFSYASMFLSPSRSLSLKINKTFEIKNSPIFLRMLCLDHVDSSLGINTHLKTSWNHPLVSVNQYIMEVSPKNLLPSGLYEALLKN